VPKNGLDKNDGKGQPAAGLLGRYGRARTLGRRSHYGSQLPLNLPSTGISPLVSLPCSLYQRMNSQSWDDSLLGTSELGFEYASSSSSSCMRLSKWPTIPSSSSDLPHHYDRDFGLTSSTDENAMILTAPSAPYDQVPLKYASSISFCAHLSCIPGKEPISSLLTHTFLVLVNFPSQCSHCLGMTRIAAQCLKTPKYRSTTCYSIHFEHPCRPQQGKSDAFA